MNGNISMQHFQVSETFHSFQTPRFKALFEMGGVLRFSRLKKTIDLRKLIS